MTTPIAALVTHITDAIEKHASVLVGVNRDGDVLVVSSGSTKGQTELASRPEQCVIYTKTAHAFDIAEDLAHEISKLCKYGQARLAQRR